MTLVFAWAMNLVLPTGLLPAVFNLLRPLR